MPVISTRRRGWRICAWSCRGEAGQGWACAWRSAPPPLASRPEAARSPHPDKQQAVECLPAAVAGRGAARARIAREHCACKSVDLRFIGPACKRGRRGALRPSGYPGHPAARVGGARCARDGSPKGRDAQRRGAQPAQPGRIALPAAPAPAAAGAGAAGSGCISIQGRPRGRRGGGRGGGCVFGCLGCGALLRLGLSTKASRARGRNKDRRRVEAKKHPKRTSVSRA